MAALEARLSVDAVCELLLRCGCGQTRPVPSGVVEKIVTRLDRIRPIGGWQRRDPACPLIDLEPDFAHSTTLLVRVYDQDAEAFLGPIRAALQDNDNKYRRVNACLTAKDVLKQRSKLGLVLLPVVVDSLELDDDPYQESADGAACDLIAMVFFVDPNATDAYLCDRFDRMTAEVQNLLADAYQQIVRKEWEENLGVDRHQFDEAIDAGFKRCVKFVQNTALEFEVRDDFAEAIESACRHHPGVAVRAFDPILGMLADLCLQKEPPARRPRLILPGKPQSDPVLEGMERSSRQLRWNRFKSRLTDCLQELAKERPSDVADGLMKCMANLGSKTHTEFKAHIVSLIGEIGGDPQLLPRVLPHLWNALMDYDSVFIRSKGIDATVQSFRSAGCKPPENIVDTLLVHLKDSFVMIHSSAIRAINRCPSWVTPEQAQDAIPLLCGWAHTYRQKDPFKLKDICRPILILSRRVPDLRIEVVSIVAELLPTEESLVNADILEILIDKVQPTEPSAFFVAKKIAEWLRSERRDPHDAHGDDIREKAYDWLHQISSRLFLNVRGVLVESAIHIAENGEFGDACRFASLFASFGDFQSEFKVLSQARTSLPEGQLHQRAMQTLSVLEQGAKANYHRAPAQLPDNKSTGGGNTQ